MPDRPYAPFGPGKSPDPYPPLERGPLYPRIQHSAPGDHILLPNPTRMGPMQGTFSFRPPAPDSARMDSDSGARGRAICSGVRSFNAAVSEEAFTWTYPRYGLRGLIPSLTAKICLMRPSSPCCHRSAYTRRSALFSGVSAFVVA